MFDLQIRLDNRPGALARWVRRWAGPASASRAAQAGVNIEVMYSDPDHQLILVVDDPVKARDLLRS